MKKNNYFVRPDAVEEELKVVENTEEKSGTKGKTKSPNMVVLDSEVHLQFFG